MNDRTVKAAEYIGAANYDIRVDIDRTAYLNSDLSEVERRLTHAIVLTDRANGGEVRVTNWKAALELQALLDNAIKAATSGLGAWSQQDHE